MQAFSSCAEQGSLTSYGVQPSRSCGTWAQLAHSLWNPPGPGIKPMLPALAGGFLHTEPPGKSIYSIFNTSSILPEFSYIHIFVFYSIDLFFNLFSPICLF